MGTQGKGKVGYRYIREFLIHERTGVLQVLWKDATTGIVQWHTREPEHIIVQGEIEAGKGRKRGVWDFAGTPDQYPAEIYYTCPWCGAIGRTSLTYEMNPDSQSLVCGGVTYLGKNKLGNIPGCGRHLTLSFRKAGKEREGFICI